MPVEKPPNPPFDDGGFLPLVQPVPDTSAEAAVLIRRLSATPATRAPKKAAVCHTAAFRA